jgi:LPS sulfotransferase NodH
LSSALKFLLESELGEKIITFFRNRGEAAHIIAPAWVREHIMANIPAGFPAPGASWSEPPVSNVPPEGVWNLFVIAESARDEEKALSALSLRKGMKAFGLFADVMPAILCGVRNLPTPPQSESPGRYAILAIPRSGSRYVAAMLTISGLGVPREHLRPPLAAAIANGELSFGAAIERLERFGQRNGIFGTKLISAFLLAACAGSLAELESNIGWMAAQQYQFLLLDRPLNDAVISNYIASRLGTWHFFGSMDQETRSVLSELKFDSDAAWKEYIRFRAQKIIMAHLAEKFGAAVFSYSLVQESVDKVVSFVRDRLKVDPAQLKVGSAAVPVPTRSESETYESFSVSLVELIEQRRNEILPETIRTLRGLLDVDKRHAERLAIENTACG